MKRLMCQVVLAALLLGGGYWGLAQEAAEPVEAEKQEAVAPEGAVAKKEKSPVAKLRGKLLYKRGQIKKMETAALMADPELAKKLKDLEAQRRALLVAAEPRLGSLYAEQDALDEEIRKMTGK